MAATASRWCRPMPARGMPLTTNLADRVRAMLHDPATWRAVSRAGAGMAASCSSERSRPARAATTCWSRPSRATAAGILVAYCFEGRNAHQTLGMLLTRRMERFGYGAARLRRDRLRDRHLVGATSRPTSRALFEQDMLGDDLEAWMAESSMLRRTFRNVAVIAGLIERNQPGAEQERAGRSR